ncbi:MAG TPA: 2'-5' RNA ligase family protein [Aequorivita sp.]|nr:2'-5' RNA ligase family protein [Aequorivita sp.]
MKKYLIVIIMGVFLSTACESKIENIIAIDVLLTPSEELNKHSILLNSLIKENNPSTLQLDENHIPHITLLQCFVKESDLPEIIKSLEGLFEAVKDESFNASKIVYDKETEDSFAMIQVDNSLVLADVHSRVIDQLKPFIVQNGSQESFVPNPDGSPINKFTVDYVPNFVEKYSYENFDPHISLGTANKLYLDSLARNVFQPIQFKAPSLAIYQLGDFGTAQKKIWVSTP